VHGFFKCAIFCYVQDWELTWTNGTNPDFTPCFEKTVLVWIPCAFLWLFSCVDAYYFKISSAKNIPWNALNLTKLFICTLLIATEVIRFYIALVEYSESTLVHPIDLITPCIKVATFVSHVKFHAL